MICDFKKSTECVELKINPDKTKIPSNHGSNKRMEATIDNIRVEVLPVKECAKYFGRTITFEQQETTEIKSRVRAAWASFTKCKQELKSKSYLLRHILCLFNLVITPTLTYACGTWTLSQEHERLIRSTQRKMLRLVVQRKGKYKKKMKKNKEEKETKSDEEPMNEKKGQKTKTVTKILKERRKKVASQTQIETKTVKFSS